MDDLKRVKPELLLLGHPNVGKSVLFSRLTGVHAVSSNYVGTTVSYTKGRLTNKEEKSLEVIDAPGIYSLEPLDDAAKVALELIDDARRIVVVVDATHLERQLPFVIEVLAQKRPTILVLNMFDEARHKGVEIDLELLAKELGVRVFATAARTGEGIAALSEAIFELEPAPEDIREREHKKYDLPHPLHHEHLCSHGCATCTNVICQQDTEGHHHLNRKKVWTRVGDIVSRTQTLSKKRHSFLEVLEDMAIHPLWGILVSLVVIVASFIVIRFLGEFLITGDIVFINHTLANVPFGLDLLFEKTWTPLMMGLSHLLGGSGFWHDVLIGQLIDGEIDYFQSFGVLTSGPYIEIVAVMPYVISFYLVMSFLEDSGHLPRMAVFLDNIMHKMGLHGYAFIPTLLGLGCNVPGIMATRILSSKQERFITATLISIAIPCASLQAMIVGILGKFGAMPVIFVYGTLLFVWVGTGVVLKFFVKGDIPELMIEIPPYRIPDGKAMAKKLWVRLWAFLKEAMPVVLASVLVVNLLFQFQAFDAFAYIFSPVVKYLWQMPSESIVPLLVGFIRKDVAVGMFMPLGLSLPQLITGAVVLAMFFPCVATFAVLIKELGFKDSLKSLAIMLIVVMLVGALVAQLAPLIVA